jgi:hypothetical protein
VDKPKLITDPFLLDAAGQVVAYWPHEFLTREFIVFPVAINSIQYFGHGFEEGQELECQVQIKQKDSRQIKSDFSLADNQGNLRLKLLGWTAFRFSFNRQSYAFIKDPENQFLSRHLEINPIPSSTGQNETQPVKCFFSEFLGQRQSFWIDVWANLLFSRKEKKSFYELGPEEATLWLEGRIAAKDAVRMWLKRYYGIAVRQADVELIEKKRGKLEASGKWTAEIRGIKPVVSLHQSKGKSIATAAPPNFNLRGDEEDG